jgi:hypothetical protein
MEWTRYGKSKAELETLFAGRVAPIPAMKIRDYRLKPVPWVGGADTSEHFCDTGFEVTFVFFDEPGRGLAWVSLESRRADGPRVGECVLGHLTVQLGRPTEWTPVGPFGPGEPQYWYHNLLSRRWTILWVQRQRVVIQYTRQRPHRYSSFP